MTKTTWHVNRCATSSREGSMYWLHSVHCTMTLTSTHYGFLTPQTLYKPLPQPLKYPYPWKGYGFASGKGKGRCENTRGLPVPITKHSKLSLQSRRQLYIMPSLPLKLFTQLGPTTQRKKSMQSSSRLSMQPLQSLMNIRWKLPLLMLILSWWVRLHQIVKIV